MTPRSRAQASAEAEAARLRAPITDRVNVEPAILNGMTVTEAQWIGAVALGIFLLVGGLVFLVTGFWQVWLLLAIFTVGTGEANGVPRPVENSTICAPAAASAVEATRSLPGAERRLRPAVLTLWP